MAIKIGSHEIANPVFAAPMAGVSDKPYRKLCRQFGAGLAVSEMVTSQLELRHSTKSRYRMDLVGEIKPVCVQIVGTDPIKLAEAAQFNVRNGAQIIDINMGCPAKKVCKKAAGSALLENVPLVDKILQTVVRAVDVPVMVKIRTGPTPQNRNAVTIARVAEQAGISAITVHGRTRQCRFVGNVEHDSVAAVKSAVAIPVIANGDICTPQQAARVLQYTHADAVMLGRAAQGQPWLFQRVVDYLNFGVEGDPPSLKERSQTIIQHIGDIHEFYGERLGLKLARKHIKWYLQNWPVSIDENSRGRLFTTESEREQIDSVASFLLGSEHTEFQYYVA